jgi:hypothetical protein
MNFIDSTPVSILLRKFEKPAGPQRKTPNSPIIRSESLFAAAGPRAVPPLAMFQVRKSLTGSHSFPTTKNKQLFKEKKKRGKRRKREGKTSDQSRGSRYTELLTTSASPRGVRERSDC